MKKNDLIKKLQGIKGNPDIVLWNGFVGDYQHIAEPTEGDLVKETLENYLEMCRLETARDAKDWDLQLPPDEVEELKGSYRDFKYEHNNYITQEDIREGRYKKKRVIYLPAKLRNETSYGRGGDLHY